MIIGTDIHVGQQEYEIDGELLGIKRAKINGRKVNVKYIISLPRVPSKRATMFLEIEKMVHKK